MFKKTLNFGEEAEEDLFFLLFLSSFKRRRLHAEKNRERERERKKKKRREERRASQRGRQV